MDAKIMFLSLSSLDNDSRILKEINTLINYGYKVGALSVNSERRFTFENNCINHNSKKIFGIPGIALLLLYLRIIKKCITFSKEIDIYHCNDLNTLPIGVFVKLFLKRKVKLVYDAHEFEPNQKPNQNKLSIKLLMNIERLLIKFADAVITVNDSIANEYVKLYKIKKPALVLNCPIYQEIKKQNIFREKLNIDKEKIIFLYQGGLYTGRGLENLIEAFKKINDTNKVLVFLGYGPLQQEIKKISERFQNIFYHPAVSPDVLLNYTSSADVGLCLIENNCLSYYYCLPNKVFEYILAGLPVIVSNMPEMRKLIENNKIGIITKGNDTDSIIEAIKEINSEDIPRYKKNFNHLAKIYTWGQQEKVLLDIYKGVSF